MPDKAIYGGYVVVTPNVGEPLRVPYVGFFGDYQSIQILNETIFGGSPLLLDGDLNDVAPDHVFTLAGADLPTIVYHQDLQARRLQLWVVHVATGLKIGRAVDFEYLARNSTSTGFFGLSWDGTFMPGNRGTAVLNAPNGTYKLVLTVEKPLAEKNNPAHTESWTSPAFAIGR